MFEKNTVIFSFQKAYIRNTDFTLCRLGLQSPAPDKF